MNPDTSSHFPIKPPERARPFFAPNIARKWMLEKAINAFDTQLNKIETPDFKLKVTNIRTPDPDKRFTLKDQKKAIMEKGDMTIPIKGDFQLIDKKSGEVVDAKKNTTIAHLPWITDRMTTVFNGAEYITANAQRLKPGIYTRIKETGELEGHVNPEAGTGLGGKLVMDPAKATFIYEVGTTGIALYGLLKDLGVSDQEMENAWGKEIFETNKKTYKGNEIDKMYSRIFKEKF